MRDDRSDSGSATSSPIAPVRKSVSVPWPPSEAFERFTAGISSWWPASTHSVGEDKVEEVVFEARVGGRIFERWKDGTTSDWGTILECDAPGRLVFTWHPGRSAQDPQRVEVTFTVAGDGTEVRLVHTGWEKLGERAVEMRNGYDSGWEGVLRCFVQGTPSALAS